MVQSIESEVTVNGVRLHYARAGAGPALVLVHGLVGSKRNWNRNIEFLAQFRTVYAVDLANMGESERVEGLDAGLEACADRLAAFMQAVGIEGADVAGHSHGGATAMMLAARHPDLVHRLVLFAPANPFCVLGDPQIRFYSTWLGGFFARNVIPAMPRFMHRRSLERMYGDKRRMVEGVLEGYTDYLDSESIEHICAVMRRWAPDMEKLKQALPQLRAVPTLLFWGDRDKAVAISSGEVLARELNAPLHVVPEAGHIPFEEMPEFCNPVIGKWLTT